MYMIRISDNTGFVGYARDLMNGQYVVKMEADIDSCAIFKTADDAMAVMSTFVDGEGHLNGNLVGNNILRMKDKVIIRVVRMEPLDVPGMVFVAKK